MALAFLRRQQWWLKYLLAFVVLSFIILYIPAFMGTDSGTPGETAARVGSKTISVGEFQRAYLDQRRRLEQAYQGRINPAMLKNMGLEDQVLDSLVSQRVVELEAKRLGLGTSDDEVARFIQRLPVLQESGRFVGAAGYRRWLDSQGRSVEEFENSVRSELMREKLAALVTDQISITPAEAEQEFRRKSEQLRAEYVLVDAARFRAQATPSDDEVRARFEAKKDAYKLPERRVVSYLLLDSEAMGGRVSVTDHDIDTYYQEHADEFRQEEQACASHILVKVKGEGSSDGHPDGEARKIAQGLLDELHQGADFATLAKKSSEDKGSASRGGDLDCFPRGAMQPEFENAAFSLSDGQTSDLVKTPFGYHIIRLARHQAEGTQPLAQVKERVRATLNHDRLQTLLEQKAGAVAGLLRKGKSLEEAATAEGLSVQKSAPFARGEDAGAISSPAMVARAFELKPGEIDRDGFNVRRGYVFIALAEVQPPRAAELKDVQDKVKADLVQERSFDKARAVAEDLKARAEKQGLDKAAASLGLVRKETPGLVGRGAPLGDLGTSLALETAAYALPEKALSDPVRATAGYAVLRVLEKKAFDPAAFEKEKPSLMASLKEERRNRLFQAYLDQARQRVEIEKHPDAVRRVAGR